MVWHNLLEVVSHEKPSGIARNPFGEREGLKFLRQGTPSPTLIPLLNIRPGVKFLPIATCMSKSWRSAFTLLQHLGSHQDLASFSDCHLFGICPLVVLVGQVPVKGFQGCNDSSSWYSSLCKGCWMLYLGVGNKHTQGDVNWQLATFRLHVANQQKCTSLWILE